MAKKHKTATDNTPNAIRIYVKYLLCLLGFTPLIAVCQQGMQAIDSQIIETTMVEKDTIIVVHPEPKGETHTDTIEYDLSYQTKIKISAKWINSLRNYDYSEKNAVKLLKEFGTFFLTDTIFDCNGENGKNYVNAIFVNLDEDDNNEIVALLGCETAFLSVFKQIKKVWYLVYFEPIYEHYVEPRIQVANNFSKHKVFYVHQLYHRGSGIYADAYHFYKLIDNKVVPCLFLINETRLYGWGMFLNQNIKSEFYIQSSLDDEIYVSYKYHFFAGAVYDDDVAWESHEEITFVEGENSVPYVWNDTLKRYVPHFYTYSKENLTADKLDCFADMGNDSLFVKAFEYEIGQTLEKGTAEQKKVLEILLKLVRNHKDTRTHEVEQVGETESGMKFYK